MYLSTASFAIATATPSIIPAWDGIDESSDVGAFVYSVDKGDSQLQRWSSLIGIITAIVGNILISFALNIQRYAHIRLHNEKILRREKSKSPAKGSVRGYGTTEMNGNGQGEAHQQGDSDADPLSDSFQSSNSRWSGCSDDDHKKHEETYLQSPYWWGGIILMTVGEAGNFLAYGFAPASIVSPLGVVALISNCVIAPIMLKERFRLRDFWGVVVAVGGAVTVVLSAKTQEKKLGPHEIIGAITRIEFVVYIAVTTVLILVLMWASPRYGNRTILVDLGLVGLFGGYTALSTKGVASMLSSALLRAFSTPITYVLILVLVGTAIMQVKYVNKALQRFDSTQVIPVQFVMFTLSVIIGSAILYRDFEKATAESVGKFTGGCLLTFFGVWLITSGRPRHEDEEDEGSSDEEDHERLVLADSDYTEGRALLDDAQRAESRRRSKIEVETGGDGADDSDDLSSRRSSRVSFAVPSNAPRTPQMRPDSSQQPSFRFTPTSDPDIAAAAENMPLLTNPWKSPARDSLRAIQHPGMSSTSSSPLLPSEAQIPSIDSLKPPVASRSATQEDLHTPANLQQGPTPPQADRPRTPARNSISRMLPGPLLSPLSSGLSAVVADSLRRGVDHPTRSRSFKRPRLAVRRTKSGNQRISQNGDLTDDEYGTSPLKQSTTAEEVSKSLGAGEWASSSRIGRARSLSNTLGELFRGKRQKRDRTDEEDEEGGPSRP